MSKIETPRDFIDARGGAHAVARVLKREPGSVRAWKVRNKLPRKAWPELIEAFPDITWEDLRALEARGS